MDTSEHVIVKDNNHWGELSCLICGEHGPNLPIRINRLRYDSSVIGFSVCRNCPRLMGNDIEVLLQSNNFENPV